MTDSVTISRRDFLKLSVLSTIERLQSLFQPEADTAQATVVNTTLYLPLIMSERKRELWVLAGKTKCWPGLFIEKELNNGQAIVHIRV
jgi:hypothetical protein